ncbi:MAG: hypothetical protein F6K41_17800 [Symploca sp. SIO3E6]|nr:hypothetical protein [Caldora sp. SIO3E6]
MKKFFTTMHENPSRPVPASPRPRVGRISLNDKYSTGHDIKASRHIQDRSCY